jgi:arylformamidase
MAEGVNSMKIIDITRPLSAKVPLYPGDAPPMITPQDQGNYHTTEIRMSSHQGTHIDAPSHYLPEGETVDNLPLPYLIGPCLVLDARAAGRVIKPEAVVPRLGSHTRLLLRTSASDCNAFGTEFPCLHMSTARALAETGLVVLGIDSPSVEEYLGDGSVHRTLLTHSIVIIELLDLWRVEEGAYDMIALPLRLEGVEGSPARVVLCRKGDQA